MSGPALSARPRPARAAAVAPLRHELVGPPGAPVVVALGGISATRHVTSSPADPSPGWWEPAVGPGRGIDTARRRVLGIDYLGGGRGPGRRPERLVTTHDQAAALAALLDRLEVERVHAVVGASYGGMVALALAERFPERLDRLVVFSAAHESHPMSTALRALQRRIVALGLETGRAREAMALARGVAMTTYRTAREFAERFDLTPHVSGTEVSFDVERYLVHCGERFAAACPPERFLALSLSADLHRVEPERVTVPAVLVAAEGDTLVPEEQMRRLAARMGGPCRLLRLPTRYGHDAFLTEPAKVGRILTAALRGRALS
jgi:homoserine O-acetyltransferase/O-succinyltransferase